MAEKKASNTASKGSKAEVQKYSYRSSDDARTEKRKRAASATKKVVRRPVTGFADFLREGAVVGLAIGFVLGTQVQLVVKQFIISFIDPMFQLLSGNQALSARSFALSLNGRTEHFDWGALVYALMDFLFVALTIYLVVKIFHLDKLRKK